MEVLGNKASPGRRPTVRTPGLESPIHGGDCVPFEGQCWPAVAPVETEGLTTGP